MRTTVALLLAFFSASAFADSLRSDEHLVKIDVQPLSATSRQYSVQVFEGGSRKDVAHLTLMTKGDAPAEAETTASGTRYEVRIEPHGESYLINFTADDGTEEIDTMRGGFTPSAKSKPQTPAVAVRAGRDIKEPAIIRRVDAAYTEEARSAGAAGSVLLEVLIDRSGFVREATVIRPMGHGLTESAVDAVRQWQFEPSKQKGVPVEVVYEVTIDFKP
ncbi:MAG TPA: energy transducer TonB [Thermoanaerobaculia bacterium]|nr:energy transducer TonB [Thermoanaerobaculia bacterium]